MTVIKTHARARTRSSLFSLLTAAAAVAAAAYSVVVSRKSRAATK
jgi:hypothetical protein